MTAPGQTVVSIECSHCGQKGSAVYAARILLKLSDGFHSEIGRTQTGEAVIVCDICDQIQP